MASATGAGARADPGASAISLDPDGDLEFQATASWLMAGAGKLVLQRWGVMLAELELTSSQYKVLLALRERGPLGQQRLAELVRIDPRNAVPIVETLVERGLLTRSVDPTDRRRRVIELSPAGRSRATRLASMNSRIDAELLSHLDDADRATLRRLLRTVLEVSPAQPG